MSSDIKDLPKYHKLYKWRDRVASSQGPPSPTMRHVLLTLSLHMDEELYCFPSIRLLAERTGLSDKAVRDNLKKAVKLGWIERSSIRGNSQGWRRYEFAALAA